MEGWRDGGMEGWRDGGMEERAVVLAGNGPDAPPGLLVRALRWER